MGMSIRHHRLNETRVTCCLWTGNTGCGGECETCDTSHSTLLEALIIYKEALLVTLSNIIGRSAGIILCSWTQV